MLNQEQASRALDLCRRAAVFVLCGIGYAVFVMTTGLAIPCPIHLITGLYCPACGASRMCLALLRLDFAAAVRANALLMALLPVLAVLTAVSGVRYVRFGSASLYRWQSAVVWGMIALLLIFGVLRNLPWFAFLAPGM